MDAKELYRAGKLQEAVEAMNAEVRKHPTDVNRRGFLCELLVLSGNFERADRLLDTMLDHDPQAIAGISLFRQLARADQWRHEFHEAGHAPELLAEPSETLKLQLKASVLLREGNHAEALTAMSEAEEARPKVGGFVNGERFEELRDLDDICAPFFEVLTSTGKYYWIPMERVEVCEFTAPTRPRDLLWREAHMVVSGGPDGIVYLPTIYGGTRATGDTGAMLGRVTEWQGEEGQPMRGIGLRTLLVGDDTKTLLELESLSFDQPEGEAAATDSPEGGAE